ncbi:MAG: dipeptide ABC transporter ATP-binding protein [Actinomycetes bacterium]
MNQLNPSSNTQALVVAHDLAKTFDVSAPWLARVIERKPRQLLKAVDGVSFEIERGKTLALVGESGCGKSTVARLLVGLYEPTRGGLTFDGEDAHAAFKSSNAKAMRKRIQMIFQDPYSSLNPRHSVGQIIGAPLQVQKISPVQGEKKRVQELMELVGLNPEHYNRYPHEFSGGQRQRIGIARSLILDPTVIVADEPVSALDVSIQAQILNLLEGLQRDLGLSYVFIAHDLSVVRHIADDVAVMYLGKIVESGPASVVYQSPAHPYTKALLSAVPVANPARRGDHERIRLVGDVPSPIDPPSGCRFRTRCWLATDKCTQEEPVLAPDASGRLVACHFPLEISTTSPASAV